jgi:hypothetical protein
MWSLRHALVTLFLGLLAGLTLFGCRAFEPETVIVNRPPNTYIIGSPAETSGAYFHFHVFWYGTDEDGFVERYVWALTDTSIQDRDTDIDDEDQRFNPALNISHLEIGNWTTRTDTVFDFRINQGSNLSTDMTLHMVAVDDRGAFDRTPARLHFFSNAVGRPRVQFYRDQIGDGHEFANFDTVAFGRPLFLKWAGTTPNIRAYDPVLLAERDTVPPLDGLLGYKWRLPAFDNCNPGVEDCWQPRLFDEGVGDSVSYFGNVTELSFLNDDSGTGVFSRRLSAGVFQLLVNTIDVAGVEVRAVDQILNIVVNHDPDTYILRSEQDPIEAHNDPLVYPIYQVFHGPQAGIYSFSEGDTVPDRAYVTFKALGWDDPRDVTLSPVNLLSFQGRYIARQRLRVTGPWFQFGPTFSDVHQTVEWTAAEPTDISADTLGFHVGPFNYAVVMRAVDEQLTRDGTPDTFRFVGNYPPCVQCIELVKHTVAPSITYDDPCWDDDCFGAVPDLQVYNTGDPRLDPSNPHHLARLTDAPGTIYVRPESGAITFEEPLQPDLWDQIQSVEYHYLVYLHGKEHPQEYWAPGRAHERIKAWRYEIRYAGDPLNAIADGGGQDDINLLTGFDIQGNQPNPAQSDLYIIPETGVWAVRVKVAAPQILLLAGPVAYWASLRVQYDCPPFPSGGTEAEILAWQNDPAVRRAFQVWRLTTMQFTPGEIQAIAADNSTCEWRRNSNAYHYFAGLRGPDGSRECNPTDGRNWLDLTRFIAYSNNAQPVIKDFNLTLFPFNQPAFQGGQNPPNWIGSKGIAGNWR